MVCNDAMKLTLNAPFEDTAEGFALRESILYGLLEIYRPGMVVPNFARMPEDRFLF